MKVKQVDMDQQTWDEWRALMDNQECAVCGARLGIRTVPETAEMQLGCISDWTHTGFRQRTSYTEDYRRGEAVPLVVQNNIEARMMDKAEFARAVNLLAVRYPKSIRDPAGAALFIRDCIRLGLDPLINPAEAVPIVFKTKDKDGHQKDTVAMIITEDGALSMAARGCREEYAGAPATMPLLDYLMQANPDRPLADLDVVAKRTARELCDDEAAFVWVAMGKRRTAPEVTIAYGYYTQADWADARSNSLPAAKQPGNQARVRAIKRWVRENFPEARQKMLEYTAELSRRSAGAIEAARFIDAEYHVLIGPSPGKPTLISSPASNQKKPAAPKAARQQGKNKDDNKAGESAERHPDQTAGGAGVGQQGGAGHTTAAASPSSAEEHDLFSAAGGAKMADAGEASAAGDGFSIPLDWLRQTLKTIKWSEDTTRSWIKHLCPDIDDSGNLVDVIKRMNRVQAETFTREIQSRAEKQPNLL